MPVKIAFNAEECIGCGACAAICPQNWGLKNGKASPKKTSLPEVGCNQDAAESCPMGCIKVEQK